MKRKAADLPLRAELLAEFNELPADGQEFIMTLARVLTSMKDDTDSRDRLVRWLGKQHADTATIPEMAAALETGAWRDEVRSPRAAKVLRMVGGTRSGA